MTIVLEALKNILHAGAEFFPVDNKNSFLEIFESHNGTHKVEELQSHKESSVYNKAVLILKEFYESEDFFDFMEWIIWKF